MRYTSEHLPRGKLLKRAALVAFALSPWGFIAANIPSYLYYTQQVNTLQPIAEAASPAERKKMEQTNLGRARDGLTNTINHLSLGIIGGAIEVVLYIKKRDENMRRRDILRKL